MIERYKKSEFFRSILLLVSGTMIAQLVTYLLTPIISRIYSPEDMSYLSLLSRIVSFLAVIATARYELAFPLPKRDEHAFSIYKSTFFLTVIISFLSILGVFGLDFFNLSNPILDSILYFIPIGIFLLAINSQGLNWAIRMKGFKIISISKILQSSVNSIFAVLFGFFSFGYKGLLIAFLLSVLVANIPFLAVFRKTKKTMRNFKLKGRKSAVLKLYSDFPTISLPHVLMDLTKELFIAFYLISIFEKEVLGLYDFAFRMLKLPIGLIGASISQVVFKQAADLINEKQSIYHLVRKTIITLLLVSILPFGMLFFFGAEIFAFVFGENWREAGYFAQIMSPWLMLNFIVSPISQIPMIKNQQRKFFILSGITTIILLFSLVLGAIFPFLHLSFRTTLLIVSYGQFICYGYIIFWMLKMVKD